MRTPAFLALAGLGMSLAACGTVGAVKDAVRGPKLNDMSKPTLAASMIAQPSVIQSSPSPQPQVIQVSSTPNSLWRPGARAFFVDQRASKPGDILTVLINIDDSAKLSNSSNSSRTNATKGQVSHMLGLEASLAKIMPKAFDPSNAIDQSGNTSSAGAGSVDRQEKISLAIAAVVTGVLPNGNMIIQGSQEVKTNNEVRELTVAGIVRPQDISATNTILHTQIAEARIDYGGRGDLTRVQKTPAAQSLMEQFSPF